MAAESESSNGGDRETELWTNEVTETSLDECPGVEAREAGEPSDNLKPEIDLTEYLERVEILVSIALRSLPGSVSNEMRNDLRGAGMLALVRAREAYDPMRFKPEDRANFKTYASKRIEGSLKDEIRSQTWGARSVLRERGLIRHMVEIGEQDFNLIDPNPHPEEVIVAADENNIVKVAVEALEPHLLEVVQAVMQENGGLTALAHERGVTQGRISQQKKTALDLVRNGILLLQGDFVPEGPPRALAYYDRVLENAR